MFSKSRITPKFTTTATTTPPPYIYIKPLQSLLRADANLAVAAPVVIKSPKLFYVNYAFKIFRKTTKLKKYSKYLTHFPRKFYIHRKRKTSNYNFVSILGSWVNSFTMEKRAYKFIQSSGLYTTQLILPNPTFLLKQLRRANLPSVSFNLYSSPPLAFFRYSSSRYLNLFKFLCGLRSTRDVATLLSNQTWVNQETYGGYTYPLVLLPFQIRILDFIFHYFASYYSRPLYQSLSLLVVNSSLLKKN